MIHTQRIPVGCESVFPAGLKQTEFSLSTDFFKLNPRLREFDIELNVTRCMTTPKGKVLCASGLTALRYLMILKNLEYLSQDQSQRSSLPRRLQVEI